MAFLSFNHGTSAEYQSQSSWFGLRRNGFWALFLAGKFKWDWLAIFDRISWCIGGIISSFKTHFLRVHISANSFKRFSALKFLSSFGLAKLYKVSAKCGGGVAQISEDVPPHG